MSQFTNGQRVWGIQGGGAREDGTNGEVLSIDGLVDYSITVRFDIGFVGLYRRDGRILERDAIPSLYPYKPDITLPKRKFRKVVEGWVNVLFYEHLTVVSQVVHPTKDVALNNRKDVGLTGWDIQFLGDPCFIRHEYEVEE